MTAATISTPATQPLTPANGTLHVEPTPVASWTPLRWTIPEYRKLGETGLFNDKKTMLVHGVLYIMTMPNPPHDTALSLAHEYLRGAFPTKHYVRNQQGFDIGLDTDPSPDLAVVLGSIRDYAKRTPTAAVLVVEISDTSLFTDTTTKAELYATAGVPEYWVIDINNRQLLVYREPAELPKGLGATAYRKHSVHAENDTVAPLASPTATICVAELLP